MKGPFTDRRVLVTAAADGVGRVIAEAFYRAGAAVHICARTQEKLERCAAELSGITYTRADVSDVEEVGEMFADVERLYGGVDFLVNNAGVAGPTARVDKVEPEEWRRTMSTNIDGQFFCTKFAVPMMMRAGGGAIVNISSTAGLFAYPGRSPYAASKWAVIGFTKTIAAELGEFGIRANAICPGCIDGPRIEGVIAREAAARGTTADAVRRGYVAQAALGTFISARDVADMCLYLCSPAGERISGQAITIDGFTENCRS